MDHRFPKAEHLCLQRDIDALFASGAHSVVGFPLRAVWHEVEWDGHGPRVKVLVSVSKRKFKHAVDRNRAKRQMREAYRLNKHLLAFAEEVATHAEPASSSQVESALSPKFVPSVVFCDASQNSAPQRKALHIGFIWISDTPQDSKLVHKRMVNILKRISEKSC